MTMSKLSPMLCCDQSYMEMQLRHLNLDLLHQERLSLRPPNLRFIADMADRIEEPRP